MLKQASRQGIRGRERRGVFNLDDLYFIPQPIDQDPMHPPTLMSIATDMIRKRFPRLAGKSYEEIFDFFRKRNNRVVKDDTVYLLERAHYRPAEDNDSFSSGITLDFKECVSLGKLPRSIVKKESRKEVLEERVYLVD